MRAPRLGLAVAVSVTMVASSMATAGAAWSGEPSGNSGATAAATAPATAPAVSGATRDNSPAVTVYPRPRDKYVNNSCLVDLSGIADFTVVDTITDDTYGVTVTVTPAAEKRSVPSSWATWGSPPDTETATPHLLYATGTTLTLSFSEKVKVGGVEIEPDPFAVHSFTVDFYEGADGTGKKRASITRDDVSGEAGAKLFGAKVPRKFSSLVITSNDGVGFAVAQIRV